MPASNPAFRASIHDIFSNISADLKMKKLRQLSNEDLHKLYSIASVFVNSVLEIEFNRAVSKHSRLIKKFLDAYRKDTPGSTTEDSFLQSLFCDLVPILYYAEHERKITTSIDVSLEDCKVFFEDFLILSVKGLPDSKEIVVKTYELKRFPKSRVDLYDDEKHVIHSADTNDTFVILQACVFQINRLRVLCGFFAKDCLPGTSEIDENAQVKWRSEKYVDQELLDQIVDNHGIVKRKLE